MMIFLVFYPQKNERKLKFIAPMFTLHINKYFKTSKTEEKCREEKEIKFIYS